MTCNDFQIGKYRPIYLWGGPGTIRMNKLKFMDVDNDETVHLEVHEPNGAQRVVEDLNCNWVHLMYDWGFPPEVEKEDWESFRCGAEAYHQLGHKVFAYIQASNCVYDGLHREKEWYARDAQGKKVYYFTYNQRYMACMNHPEWQEHLQILVRGAIERGADGIFLDNLFQGDQPMSMFRTWFGSTGCHCELCQKEYLEMTGRSIPALVPGNDPELRQYLRFRSAQVTKLISLIRDYANQLQPGTPISCNDFDPILRNSYLLYGIDLPQLAKVQEVVMIENFGLPLWTPGPKPRLGNNALTVRNARTLVKDNAHLNVLSYDVGIGFDPVYPPRQYQQGIGEAAALGVSMTTKGTEYHDGSQMTLLTDPQYKQVHRAIAGYHHWLEDNAGLFLGRSNHSSVAILFPGENLWLDWLKLAAPYFEICQALTVNGIPWQVIDPGEEIHSAVSVLILVTDDMDSKVPVEYDGEVIRISSLAGWQDVSKPGMDRRSLLYRAVSGGLKSAMKAYTVSRFARWLFDKLQLAKMVTQSPFYYVPPAAKQAALMESLPADIRPRAISQEPVLIDYWMQGDRHQVHLANYADQPQTVDVYLPWEGRSTVVSPDHPQLMTFDQNPVSISLDIYAIIRPV